MANPRYVLDEKSTVVGKEATYPPGPSDSPKGPPAVKPAPRLVGSRDVVTGRQAEREFHFSTLELAAYDWARTHDARVLVGTSGEYREPGELRVWPLFMLVVPRTESPFFVGGCVGRDLEQPLRAALGPRYESTLRALLKGPVAVPTRSH